MVVFDLGSRCSPETLRMGLLSCYFETHLSHYDVSLSKTLYHLLIILVQPRKTEKRSDMTGKMLTMTQSNNTNSHKLTNFHIQMYLPKIYIFKRRFHISSVCLMTKNVVTTVKICLKRSLNIDKTKILMTNGSLMEVKVLQRPVCNTFDLH